MKLFNIGIPEGLLLVLLIFIILGPGRIVSSARRMGTWFRKISQSQIWHDLVMTSNEIKEFPQKIMREADLDSELNSLSDVVKENTILPGQIFEVEKDTNPSQEGEDRSL